MTVPEITLCADGHYRLAIYGLGPYIADYPEQVLLANIVQDWCPRYVLFLRGELDSYTCQRCTAKPDNLDGPAGTRSRGLTAALTEEYGLKVLWEDYGIVRDVIVGLFAYFFDLKKLIHCVIQAVHRILPPRRYTRGHDNRYTSSTDQRNIQGPSRYVGWQIPRVCARRGWCSPNSGGYRPSVSAL